MASADQETQTRQATCEAVTNTGQIVLAALPRIQAFCIVPVLVQWDHTHARLQSFNFEEYERLIS